MANRSAPHSWPLSGFSAERCALRAQQLSTSSQFGPASGGDMTAGLRVCTVTGATVSVIAAGNDGGCGWASETLIVCERLAGMVGGPFHSDVQPYQRAQSRTHLRGGLLGTAQDAGPVRELVAREGQQRLVAG